MRLLLLLVLLWPFTLPACEVFVDVFESPSSDVVGPPVMDPFSRDAALDVAVESLPSNESRDDDAGLDGDRSRGTVDARAEADAGAAGEGRDLHLLASRVAAGQRHTCAVSGGRLYCWGDDPTISAGAGRPVALPRRIPTEPDVLDWLDVATGGRFACARNTGGEVWCWGDNAHGQLGVGDRAPRRQPVRVPLPTRAVRLSGKFDTACVLLAGGAVWCWGANLEGQLGQMDTFPGNDSLRPLQVDQERIWIDVDAGQGHVCGIRVPGNLMCWGRNTSGELGLGPEAPNQIRHPAQAGDVDDWFRVSAGQSHTCAIRHDGTLWCWGENGLGQLGVGDRSSRSIPTRVPVGDDWAMVSVNTFGGCGIRHPGSLWCWGRNAEGQLGTGDDQDRDLPLRIGEDVDWTSVSSGRFHTCGLTRDRWVWCTGENADGQLGTGDRNRRSTFSVVRAPAP